uniref:hypothetical protein n=1 Tax=Aeromonas dhakensis TaxID=196024 RepID=UPI001FCC5433
IVSVVRLLALSPPSLYDEILKASRSETLLLRIADEPLQPDNRMSCGGGTPLRSFIIRLWCCQARLRWASCLSSALISTIRVEG